MQTLGHKQLLSFVAGSDGIKKKTNYAIRSQKGLIIDSFHELVKKVARLSFYNPEQTLFFRGQPKEFLTTKGNTTIKPSVFRPEDNKLAAPNEVVLRARYSTLREAERRIVKLFSANNLLGKTRLIRSRIIQWAIIQHYEICRTPLLDVTHSLRVAASFATVDPQAPAPVLYVLAVPSNGGTISASSEQGIQTIRLSSICPPDAHRPYFQEGYLLGEYPDLASFDEKQNYPAYEIDFGTRLLCKFHLNRNSFWNDPNYQPIPKDALFPNNSDPLFNKTQQIADEIGGNTNCS